jgi:hypothetical protein
MRAAVTLTLCALALLATGTQAALRGTALAADASLADGLDANDTDIQEMLLDRCGWIKPADGKPAFTKTCSRNLCCSASGFCGDTPAHCLVNNNCQAGE